MRLAAVCVVVTLLAAAGCSAPRQEPPPSEQPAVDEDLLKTRQLLGAPVVALAERAAVLSEDLDAVRYTVERGRPMKRGARTLHRDITDLRQAAADLLSASRLASVPKAADVAKAAVTDALDAAAAAQSEAAYLQQIADVDVRLGRIATGWDRGGSQSEQRERLAAEAATARMIGDEAAAIGAQPPACPRMVDNRVTWARTVARRTQRLAANANSFSGDRYDELRDSYRDEPFGEDPLKADGEDRSCWLQSSDVATTAEDLRRRVEEVEHLLSALSARPGVVT